MRPILSKELLKESKMSQIMQIKDKQKQRELEKDELRMWHEINNYNHNEDVCSF